MMGKAKRIKKKIKENQEEKLSSEMEKQREGLEAELRQYMEEEQYADALEILAELIKIKDIQPEFLYDGAYAYFMLGDYERAAKWVDNVLQYDGGNLRARILLARICILEDRVDDGLAVFDFVLKNGKNNLSDEDKEEIEDIVSYYVRRDAERIRQQYPHIAAFIERQEDVEEDDKMEKPPRTTVESSSSQPSSGGSARDILQALKNKVASKQAEEATPLAMNTKEQESQKATESGGNAKAILQALRDKVLKQASLGNESETPVQAKIQDESPSPKESSSQSSAGDAKQKLQMVMQQKISLQDKIRLLNAFAGGYYYQKDLVGAKDLLMEALNIDSCNMTTLTNLAWVLLELGEKEKAIELATQAQLTDFALIRTLRDS